jgi:hypothetical protein
MNILLQINEDNGTTTEIEADFDFTPSLGDFVMLKNGRMLTVDAITHIQGNGNKFHTNFTLNPLPKEARE